MTISSIYTNQPGVMPSPGEVPAPGAREGSAANAGESGTLQEVTDQAKLSALAPRIQAMFSQGAGSGGNVADTLSTNIEKLQDGFVETLYAVFYKENISVSQKITLRLDDRSRLTVAGEHPEKEHINSVLAEHSALSSAFGEIASQSEVLRDIANINKVITRHTGMEAYTSAGFDRSPMSAYQISMKGDMSHFYFSRT